MTPSLLVQVLPDPEQTVTLNQEQTRYLTRVLRLGAGDTLFLFDGRGGRCRAVISDTNPKAVSLRCAAQVPVIPESPVHITLLQGVPKGEKMDLIVQKASELGVHSVVPVMTERTQVQKGDRTDRWRRVAEAAAAQCGRSTVPSLAPVAPLRNALEGGTGKGVVFWEKASRPLSQCLHLKGLGELTILVGPEGGLTEREVTLAENAGLTRAGLGPRLLRTETAAIVSVALIQYLFGDLGS